MPHDRARIFIASSSDSLPLAHALKVLLQSEARPTVWNEGVFGVSQYTLDELLRASGEYDFAAFIFSADDTVESRGSRFLVARDNVLLELGLFAGRLGRERVFVVAQQTPEPLRLPSDLDGLGTTRFRWPAGASFAQVDAEVLQTALRPCAQAVRAAMQRAGGRADREGAERIEGRRLFEHEGYYPIDIAPGTNLPSLNSEVFGRAIRHFLVDEHYDRLAAMDLVYLREDNLDLLGGDDVLLANDRPDYEQLVEKYGLLRFIENFRHENERVFGNFIRVVNDIGDTLSGVHCEILLHNVRNPLRSIIAARNCDEVSGRRLFDPSTRFVVQFVRNQGKLLIKAMKGEGKVSYLKQFDRTSRVKATTTPLYHDVYGLVGILCVNIDIDTVNALDDAGLRRFREKYVENTGVTPAFEKNAWDVA
jgi:predicted transcriptional regulator YheO